MKISKEENFTIISNEGENLTDFASELTSHHSDFEKENLVINLLEFKDLSSSNLLAFLEISDVHRNAGKSFVLVNDSMGIDDLPDELVVVPTLQEAEDMIQMDEIQRDLGF
ncbi:ribonuclease Z [Christiangramia sabulilitoris]|uniref:Ribonuclease Z n=1 Tax=Christiangramia sabulilitoris TaxID=2583991 RepID=A0A550HX17_9FLAO|nr:ribonuclease Z [Christiangramia sabulilitoris]TRO63271.1 ribonuclease Z [Christiangramia sabulilitoris]